MIDLLERIGPFLGIAAFLGLAVLAFLIIQQARDLRRLREWAGRAPERAAEADDAVAAAAEARGEVAEEAAPAAAARTRSRLDPVREWLAARYEWLDRRMPVDPRYLIAVVAAVVVAVAVLTSGFGVLGGDAGGGNGSGKGGGGKQRPDKVEVAVLNATQIEDAAGTEIQGVQGLAAKIGDEVVKPAGFKVGAEQTAASGFEETTIMFEPGSEADADKLAARVADQLGETPVTPMISEVRQLARDAPLAIVVGQDDAEF